jgi:hypothetical protein
MPAAEMEGYSRARLVREVRQCCGLRNNCCLADRAKHVGIVAVDFTHLAPVLTAVNF